MLLASLKAILPAVCCLPTPRKVTEEIIMYPVLSHVCRPPVYFVEPQEFLIADHSNFNLPQMLYFLVNVSFLQLTAKP